MPKFSVFNWIPSFCVTLLAFLGGFSFVLKGYDEQIFIPLESFIVCTINLS